MPVANRRPPAVSTNSIDHGRQIRVRPSASVDYEIFDLDKIYVRSLVIENHYTGLCPGIMYCYGLFENGRLVGCVVYSKPASYTLCKGVCGPEYRQYVIELSRLVILTATPNAASFLIGGSLRILPDHIVVSYADCNDHVGQKGYVYQACNFIFTGQGTAEPIWRHPDSGEVISYRRRHVETKAKRFGLTKKQLVQQPQVGKYRYIYFTGTKRFKRTTRQCLRYQVLPYPKGETRRAAQLPAELVLTGNETLP